MAKITIETKGKVSKKESEEAFQIANKTFDLLKEAGYENNVEIIKVTCWREREIAGVQAGHYGVDFQLVFVVPRPSIPPLVKEEGFKVIALWNKTRYKNVISVYKDEHDLKMRALPQYINLQDEEVETLAKILIEAMRVAIRDRRSRLHEKVELLNIAERELEPLTKDWQGPKIIL